MQQTRLLNWNLEEIVEEKICCAGWWCMGWSYYTWYSYEW